MPETTSAVWQIELFGTLIVRDPEGGVWRLTSRKATELLAYLALSRTVSVGRDAIAEALWPDTDLYTGRNRLKATLSNLHKDIPGIPVVAVGKNFLEIDHSAANIDFEQTERRLKWRKSLSGRQRADFAKQLLETVGKDLLPDLSAPWVFFERNRYLKIREELLQDVEAVGRGAEARFQLVDPLSGVDVPLVGREREVSELLAFLNDGDQRRLHVVGMPGVGKTRLLREATNLLGPTCDALISLSTVQASEVAWLERIGQALGVRGADEVSRSLVAFLRDFRNPFLFLDDIDQAPEEMRRWIDETMAAVPRLRLIGTARRRPADPDVAVLTVERLPEQEKGALELLLAFADHFGLSAEKAKTSESHLAAIASRLEGLPLALEIAAAWLPILGPASLARRLETSLDLITKQAGAGRGSLADCVSAILGDLSERDRLTLVALSQCRGGCGEALAEAMLGPDWAWSVRTLVDRSLAQKVDGYMENRFLVVQAIREAVTLVVDQPTATEAKRRWRQGCLDLAHHAYFELNEGDRRRWLDWLRDEGANLLAAFESETDRAGLGEAIERLYIWIPPFWLIGLAHEARDRYHKLLDLGEAAFLTNDAETPMGIVERRALKILQDGHKSEALRLAARHSHAVRVAGDKWRAATTLKMEGQLHERTEEYEAAIECWSQAAELYLEAGYPRHALWLLSAIIKSHRLLNRFGVAREMVVTALAQSRELGDWNSEGVYLKVLAVEALERHDFEQAFRFAKDSVEAFRQAGETVTLAHALMVLIDTLLVGGCFDEAHEALQEAEELLVHPGEEDRLRLEMLRRLVARRVNGRVIYEHVLAEH